MRLLRLLTLSTLMALNATAAPSAAERDAQIAKADTAFKQHKYQETIDILKPLANAGDLESQIKLAMTYGMEQDYPNMRLWFAKAADNGSDDAKSYLASMYRAGVGGPKDEAKAIQLFEESADAGSANAQAQLGYLYEKGESGLKADPVQARYWYEKAASQDNNLSAKVAAEHGLRRLDGKE